MAVLAIVLGCAVFWLVMWGPVVAERRKRLRLGRLLRRSTDDSKPGAISGRIKSQMRVQLEGALLMLAGLLRTGMAVEQALQIAGADIDEPLQSELKSVTAQYQAGKALDGCLEQLAERTGLAELSQMATAIYLTQITGADIAPVLEGVAERIREDRELARELKQRTGELQFAARLLLILPWIMGGLTFIVNPDAITLTMQSTPGRSILGACLLLWAAGVIWMRQIVDPRQLASEGRKCLR